MGSHSRWNSSYKKEDEVNIQVLVAYATKYRATAEIAEKIGQVLRQAGLRTDVLPADRVSDLSSYQAVVLGSAVYISKWRKEAAKFLQANETVLAERQVWLFSSGPTGEGDPVELGKAGASPSRCNPSPTASGLATSPSFMVQWMWAS